MSAWTQTLSGWFTSRGTAGSNPLPVRLGGRGSFSATGSVPQVRGFDQPLAWVVVALLLWGLVMVYSASIAMPDNPKFARYTHTYFLVRHAMWMAMAFVAALMAFQVPIAAWEKAAPWLFVASLVLLIAVLIPVLARWFTVRAAGFRLGRSASSLRNWPSSRCCCMPLTTWCAKWT
jgi:cell division protein FtsW